VDKEIPAVEAENNYRDEQSGFERIVEI